MAFARRVFLVAGVYGLIVLLPMYFLERRTSEDYPPAITHPEYYYGFIGVAVAWQLAFLLISRDPARYRPLMPVAVVEKATFGIAAPILFAMDRIPVPMLAGGIADLVLGTLFVVAYLKTRGTGDARR